MNQWRAALRGEESNQSADISINPATVRDVDNALRGLMKSYMGYSFLSHIGNKVIDSFFADKPTANKTTLLNSALSGIGIVLAKRKLF